MLTHDPIRSLLRRMSLPRGITRRLAAAATEASCAILLHPRCADAGEPSRSRLELAIETPQSGALIGDPEGAAFISGRALAHFGTLRAFDIMFVIDQSKSTLDPSGADVNGDGRIDDRRCPSLPLLLGILPGMLGACRSSRDSILAAELASVRSLLDQFDPRTTRVGLVSFSGDRRDVTPAAVVVEPLTSDYAQVKRGLREIEVLGASGQTNIQAAIQTATLELTGSLGALSRPQERAQKIMLLLTDGVPTLPYDGSSSRNRRVAIEAARTAASLGVRIDTYGIGPDALSNPVVVVEVAHITHGIFTPVTRPRDLQSIFEQVNFSEIDQLQIRNLTNEEEARYSLRNADGTFSALLDMVEGENNIEVYARATDGSEERQRITVEFSRNAAAPSLELDLLAKRNRLLENRLDRLREVSIGVQSQRNEQVRRELFLRIEQERKKVEERARRVRVEAGGSNAGE